MSTDHSEDNEGQATEEQLLDLIGLGDFSAKKSYYPELQKKIHELEAEKEKLKETEAKFRSYVEAAPDGIFVVDQQGVLDDANASVCTITGYSRDELIGMQLPDLIHPDDRRLVREHLRKVIARGHAIGDVRFVTKSGDVRHWTIDAVRLSEKRFLYFAKDVTTGKEMEARLRQAEKMQAVGQLAGGVAHDFNNMLGGILGAAELLATKVTDNPGLERYIGLIIESAERASGLTSNLLAFARQQPATSKAVDIHRLLEDTTELLRSTIDRRISIEHDLGADSCCAWGDASQLQSVFLNLGINASHAMPDGGTITIQSRLVELDGVESNSMGIGPGTYVAVKLSDTGCGIAGEDLTRIFEPFFTTKPHGEGTGLGLAVAYGTVLQHDGAITVDSQIGHGTTFKVLLPLVDEHSPPEEADAHDVSGSGYVLVVDDEEVMRLTAQAILEDLGYTVVVAEDGQDAIHKFLAHQEKIDLVLLDMIMPKMNGKDCFRALQQIRPGLPVILASGYTRSDDLQELLDAGLCEVISKPYRRLVLAKLIHDVLMNSPASTPIATPRSPE